MRVKFCREGLLKEEEIGAGAAVRLRKFTATPILSEASQNPRSESPPCHIPEEAIIRKTQDKSHPTER